MSTRYKGSILSSTAAASSSTAAYGIWKQSEVAQLINTAWPPTVDPFWSSVSMLLHGDGTNGAQNNTFLDSSVNNITITRNGAATQGSFNPFNTTAPYSTSVSSGSIYFNGTGYLNAADNTVLNMAAGNFTMECWVYLTATPASDIAILGKRATNATFAGISLYFLSGSSAPILLATVNGTTWGVNFTSSRSVSLNTWTHVAVTRSANTWTLWVGGLSGGAVTLAGTVPTNTAAFSIGATAADGAVPFNGHISNMRVVKGTALYTATFTPSTIPLTAVTNTSLLLLSTNAGIFDSAIANDFITVGTAQISTSVFKYGTGSMSFSGTGAWLTAPDKTNLQLSTGDFTIEGWVYINTAGAAYSIISKGAASTGWSVGVTSGNLLQFAYTATSLTGATTLSASTWYYFAVVRSGSGTGNLKIYLNGTADATSAGAVTDNFNQTDILYVGASRTGTTPLAGYIDELRITKGVARYTANFTSPQQAFPSQ
jgi:Concanavalin A-like lectin/glucanases superfamily